MTQVRTYHRSFGGGEVTPEFFGKVDDVKNQIGLQTCRNFEPLPHGPVRNRAGTRFVKEVKDSTKSTRLVPFYYSDNQTFSIELGAGYFRFHTQGSTLLAGSPAAYNGGTAYVVGDLVESGGTNYYCIAATTGNAPPNASFWYAMPANGTFEIPNAYAEADLFEINYVQSQDVMTFTHPNNPPMELRRLGATNWTFVEIDFVSVLDAPANISATTSTGSGSETYTYTVTALDETGKEESLEGTEDDVTNDLLTGSNANTVTWDAVSGASRYNVYKKDNGLFGYIGQTTDTSFIDQNITADISQTPPIQQDPFNSATNYPRAVSYYEQRRDFGGTDSNPQNIWMTRAGSESNLSFSIPTRSIDAINFRIAAREENTVRHLVPLVDLVVLTSSASWIVTSVNSDSIEPDSIAVRPQSYVGAAAVQPLVIDNVIVFAAARGGHAHALGYSAERNAYTAKDIALRAPHLFNHLQIVDMTYAKAPYPFAYMTSSNGVMLGLTYIPDEDVLAWHWHDSYTNAGDTSNLKQSLFKSVCAVAEGDEDFLYAIVEREIDGSTVKYIERFASRRIIDLHDSYFTDCGVTLDNPITVSGITNASPGVVTATAHGFSNNDKVDFLEVEGMTDVNQQRYYVANVTANTFELNDEFGNDIDTSEFGTYISGGEVREAVSTISSGLDHLEGEKVSILANGAVQTQQTVTAGSITLEEPASIIQVGLPIEADVQTLPLAYDARDGAFGQGRRKNVNQVWMRVYRSSGIFAGPSFGDLTEKKQRSTEPYGTPPELKTAELPLTLGPKWGEDGVVCVRQSDPLPLTLLSLTMEVSVGA